jgi:hypothetical protein
VGRPTQGSGANAATLGFIPLPRWGIGDRAYDGPRAGPLTRGRTGAAVGASGLCAPPAVRGLLSGALKGRCPPAQGNALGTRVPLRHSTLKGEHTRVQQPHLTHRPMSHPVRVLDRGAPVFPGRCPGLVCAALSGQKDNSPGSCVNGCVSVHAGTGLTCGGALAGRSDLRSARCRCQWPRGSGVTVVGVDRSAPSPTVERTRCPRHIGAVPTDRGSTTTTTTARRVGRLADHDNGSASRARGTR